MPDTLVRQAPALRLPLSRPPPQIAAAVHVDRKSSAHLAHLPAASGSRPIRFACTVCPPIDALRAAPSDRAQGQSPAKTLAGQPPPANDSQRLPHAAHTTR